MALNKIDSTNLKDDLLVALSSPRITSIVYPGDDTAADPAGGQTITLKGGGFTYGAVVKVNGSNVAATTLVDFTTITFSGPALATGSYSLQVVNADGGTATASFYYVTSTIPSWSTASGSLGSRYEANTITPINLSASSDSATTYSLTSGSLPGGLSLASNGQISGTLSTLASSTTYSFTIDAVDAELQNTSRSFTYTVNADSVTFTTANNLTMNATQNSAITSNTIVATSAAGRTITYSSSSLPTGISINATSGVITGTPTTVSNVASIITATANTTNKSANITFNFNIASSAVTEVLSNIVAVAGGGGGGNGNGTGQGAGGGGGGFVEQSSVVFKTANTYTVVVGGGGNPASNIYAGGSNGSDSTITGFGVSITAKGGGQGGFLHPDTASNRNGFAGGSGGGGLSGYSGGASNQTSAGTSTGGYGNSGGSGSGGAGGGGGGAGAAGTAGTDTSTPGNGGAGRYTNISGTNTAYAGGGGGMTASNPNLYSSHRYGTGGVGGGATPIAPHAAVNADPNTGGGGPGLTSSGGYGYGGSGIVFISYPGTAKFTGGTITTVGSNTVHTFTSSGSLVPV